MPHASLPHVLFSADELKALCAGVTWKMKGVLLSLLDLWELARLASGLIGVHGSPVTVAFPGFPGECCVYSAVPMGHPLLTLLLSLLISPIKINPPLKIASLCRSWRLRCSILLCDRSGERESRWSEVAGGMR